ncbi:MAG: tRNA-dihydrouridine synthase family protein, partial [Victivallales bacterium]|nr:tRNA-dihydrouridine synthase family protein [Victivallales bacterium]
MLAPMAGYTDLPFRMSCRAQGAFYMFTALIDSGALVHGNKENGNILRRGKDEPWLGVQLLGSIEGDIAKSAEMLDDMDFEVVDFNMGCPMQKVTKRPAGAALLFPENHRLAFRCVELIRARTHRPFTVKIRILDFEDPAPTVEFCRRLESLGVDGVTIHGRLTKSIYSGPVATAVIAAVRESLSIPVTANGGVFSFQDAQTLAHESGCGGIMVARGALGNPWIFRDLAAGAA